MEGDRCSKTTRQHLTSGGELRDAGAPTALRAASHAYRASDVTDAPESTRRLDPVSFEVIAGHDRGDTKQARQALSIMAAMMLIAELTPIPAEAEIMKIRITLNGKAITATLSDNATSRDFVSMLPINLTLRITARPKRLAICRESSPRTARPRVAILQLEMWPTTRLGGM